MKESEYKKIFEDNCLSDQDKYNLINSLQNKPFRFWSIALGLSVIIWPFLHIFTNIDTDKSNLSPIVASRNIRI